VTIEDFAAHAAKEKKMICPTRTIEVFSRDNDHCKRLKDPTAATLYHLEAFLPFSEAVKLEKGNANLRPPSEKKKPFQEMIVTVEDDPASFHKKNRGITYLCERFEFDNAKKRLLVSIPVLDVQANTNGTEVSDDEPRFGIADGGHTYEVIRQTVDRMNELKELQGWTEPFVRVHFLAGESVVSGEIDQIVEALNTSSQVQQYTLDEYQNKFDDLKKALSNTGFEIDLVAFRENEEKEWDIREIVQRMACFLKDRWKFTQPTSMYRSKGKALDLFTNDATRPEFEKLYGVIRDVITLPEFVQSQFSRGSATQGKRFGGLRAVKTLKRPQTRPGTNHATDHLMDLAASLPIAAAFRELLELSGDRYVWKVRPEVVFGKCGEELYKVLASKSRTAKSVNSLGSDTELWTQAVNIVLRTKDEFSSAATSGARA
jgi:AIPR protein